MPVNSIQKGKAGERELSNYLKGHGFNTRRSQQYAGTNNDADLVGIDGLHIECKRVEKLNLDSAIMQAVHDTRGEDIPVVMHRKNRTKWKVTLHLDDFIEIIKKAGFQ